MYGFITIKQAHSIGVEPCDLLTKLAGLIKEKDVKIRSYLRFDVEHSISIAKKAPQNKILSGIPIAIKDNICEEGVPTTCASKVLEGFKPPYDATVIRKLKRHGAVPFGKTNMDEFAFGSSTESSFYHATKNPWDITRVPGGSSGGSAAAVAAGLAVCALGSDTGGSIRQPASFCGVVGLKPTYGRVSRYGLIAFASSLDQIGPITRTVEDSASILQAIAGYDPLDSTSADMPVPDYSKSLIQDVKGLRIGIPEECFVQGLEKGVENSIKQAISLLEKLGCQIVKIKLPHMEYCIATYCIVATAEASSNLARFDAVRFGFRTNEQGLDAIQMVSKSRGLGFGAEAKRRILLGTYVLSSGYYDAYYLKAQKVRTLIKKDFEHAFEGCDCIIMPTSPTPAFKIGEKTKEPLAMYLSDIFTISVNLAGLPAISVPCGFSSVGLPIGMQIIGRLFDEPTLFRVGFTYQCNTEWHKRMPGEVINGV
jgi:aspartyl-tRNA(Asn)/glutamyl-tRNA(Gln) amidotransferase subunit A